MPGTSTLNSHWFEEMYKELGINLNTLGCIMLDVEPLPIMISDGQVYKEPSLHKSTNPERKWINGWIASDVSHITLLYGLMDNGHTWRKHVDTVLKDWSLKEVEIEKISYFDSPYEDEEYYCIVAHMKITPQLQEGHDRLQFIPHINTFPGYKAHMTICYIKKDEVLRDSMIHQFKLTYVGQKLQVKPELNYGYLPKK